jgi:hypothetical protein
MARSGDPLPLGCEHRRALDPARQAARGAPAGPGELPADADRDPNCVFPLERLRELEAAGVIGELAPAAVSFVTLYSARREVAERRRRDAGKVRRARAEPGGRAARVSTPREHSAVARV